MQPEIGRSRKLVNTDGKTKGLARKKNEIAALPAFAEDVETRVMLEQVDSRSTHLEKIKNEVHEWEKQNAKASEADLRSRAETRRMN